MRRLAVVFWMLAGCVTPSIPIPPPDPAKMTFHVDGTGSASTATFSYAHDDQYVDAVVFVFNRDVGQGVIQSANADGSIGPTQPFPAKIGDRVEVSVQRVDQTESTCVRVKDGAPDAFDPC